MGRYWWLRGGFCLQHTVSTCKSYPGCRRPPALPPIHLCNLAPVLKATEEKTGSLLGRVLDMEGLLRDPQHVLMYLLVTR